MHKHFVYSPQNLFIVGMQSNQNKYSHKQGIEANWFASVLCNAITVDALVIVILRCQNAVNVRNYLFLIASLN